MDFGINIGWITKKISGDQRKTCCHLASSKILPANAGMKDSQRLKCERRIWRIRDTYHFNRTQSEIKETEKLEKFLEPT